ncbi:S8 family peptidase [Geodermatophilus sp. SYSU D00698]
MSSGQPAVVVGLLDGPVAEHPDFEDTSIQLHRAQPSRSSERAWTVHGTFVAGILSARRGSPAPALCPSCTLLVRPVLHEPALGLPANPSAHVDELADGIVECVDAGAHVLNLSVTIVHPSTRSVRRIDAAIDYAAVRGCMVVAAAGNQGTLASSAITRHPWVIPVSAHDRRGRPLIEANLGHNLGTRGLAALGEAVVSLAPGMGYTQGGGTSASTAFVAGAAALIRSISPHTPAGIVKAALADLGRRRTLRSVVPPSLDAQTALMELKAVSLT